MSSTDDPAFPLGLNLLSTPERLRARFHTFYEVRKNAFLLEQVRPTQDDYEAFQKADPEQGEKLARIEKQNTLSTYSMGTGAILGAGLAMRQVRSPILILISAGLSSLTSFYVGHDIGSWIYGTYKFDIVSVNRDALLYIRDHRRPAVPEAEPASISL